MTRLEQRARELNEFLAFVDQRRGQGPDGECHEWRGPRMAKGYGSYKSRPATHYALYLSGRERPSLRHGALHSCDNPACVNPNHLRWGDQKENAADAIARLRYPNSRKTHCPQGHEYTPENTRSKRSKYGHQSRHCRVCHKLRCRELRARKRLEAQSR